MSSPERPLLLEVNDLKTHFFLEEGTVQAVNGVSFALERGQTLGVVGESGCGKSVMARSLLNIVPRPGRIVDGSVVYHRPQISDGATPGASERIELTALDAKGAQIRSIRGSEISMVFQEPMTSFSPVHTIGFQIMESILLHRPVTADEARQLTIETLRHVGMPQPERTIDRYPHQLSGGMRQRAMIAMALACRPNLLIADEPTTALDVTTQAQILTLMRELQHELGMAIVFITHDLGVIAQMTETVMVMYLGRVVEMAQIDPLFYAPQHPYTQALLRSIPRLGERTRSRKSTRLNAIQGTVPDPYAMPRGCAFHTRCPFNDQARCVQEEPALREIRPGHFSRCHYAGELSLPGINLMGSIV